MGPIPFLLQALCSDPFLRECFGGVFFQLLLACNWTQHTTPRYDQCMRNLVLQKGSQTLPCS